MCDTNIYHTAYKKYKEYYFNKMMNNFLCIRFTLKLGHINVELHHQLKLHKQWS